ncbi:hypothetical protein O974_10230 [Mycobacterium avium 11-0986]|nr:hypothetical protein O974_10230 [Mycobacterium avium 11-0986]
MTLAGFDVILVHRMLKNLVPVAEYVLMTDPVVDCLDEPMRALCMPLVHVFEGIGETPTYYIDLAEVRVPVTEPQRSLLRRLGATMRFEFNSLPFTLGMKEPAEGFRNLGRGGEEIPA